MVKLMTLEVCLSTRSTHYFPNAYNAVAVRR